MRKYRSVFIVAIALIVLAGVSGCQTTGEQVELDVAACAQKLFETIAFEDTLTPVDEKMASILYQTAAADVVTQQLYVSTGATAEEIAVFEAVDVEAAERIKTAVLQRAAEQESSFRDYLPAEVPKLQNSYVHLAGRYVFFCISNHNDEAEAVVTQILNDAIGRIISKGYQS